MAHQGTNRDENLVEDGEDYVYYHHSKYPLHITLDYNKQEISVTVTRFFKGQINKEMTKKSKVLDSMTKEQKEEYILDVVYAFLKK